MIPSFIIFGKEIGVYALTSLIGALLVGFLAYRAAPKQGLDELEAVSVLLVSSVGVFFGMHLLYGLTMLPYLPQLRALYPPEGGARSLLSLLLALFGGSVFYGGLLGGLLAGFLYVRRKKLSVPGYGDLLAPYIPFFHMFGRIGCFLGGCCYGVECPVGFVYTASPIPAANGVTRFPVQLLEAFCLLLLSLLLLSLRRKGKYQGKLLGLYLASYAPLRFLLEFLRGDDYRGFFLGLSTSQLISLLILLALAFCACRRRCSRKRSKSEE